jgi:hypothetical protein
MIYPTLPCKSLQSRGETPQVALKLFAIISATRVIAPTKADAK